MKRRNFITGAAAVAAAGPTLATEEPKKDVFGWPNGRPGEPSEWDRNARLLNRAHELLEPLQIHDLLHVGREGSPKLMANLVPREEHKDRMSYFLHLTNLAAVEKLVVREHLGELTPGAARCLLDPADLPDVPDHHYAGLHYINDIVSEPPEAIRGNGYWKPVTWKVAGEPIVEVCFEVDGCVEPLRIATGIPARDLRQGVSDPPVPVPHFVINGSRRVPLLDLLEYLEQKYA